MAGKIEARLKALGITLPVPAPARVAKIENCTLANGFLFVSGQVPKQDGEIKFVGKLGREFTSRKARRRRGSARSTCWPMCAPSSAAISTASSAS